MKRYYSLSSIMVLALFAATAWADVTGIWKAEATTPNGAVTITYNFKQDGTTLTGAMRFSNGREVQLLDGKVNGDKLVFAMDNRYENQKFTFEGTIKDEKISLTVTPGDNTMTLERQK